MKRSRVVFPYRQPSGGAQPKLAPCRAWRIVARDAAEFASGAPVVADGVLPAAPAGTLAGAYPVWVKVTDVGGADVEGLLCVTGDGWNTQPMGRDWRVEYVGVAGGAAGDRFAYVVEYLEPNDSLDLAGQVNTSGGLPPPEELFNQVSAANTAINSGNLNVASCSDLFAEVLVIGGLPAGSPMAAFFDPDLSVTAGEEICGFTIPVTGAAFCMAWGRNVGQGAAVNRYLGGLPAPLPSRARIDVSALGAGISARLRVLVRRW